MIEDILYPDPEDDDACDEQPTEHERIEAGSTRYKEAYDALEKVTEPHVLLVLADGGVHFNDSTAEHSDGLDTLVRIFKAFACYVHEVVGEGAGITSADAMLTQTIYHVLR